MLDHAGDWDRDSNISTITFEERRDRSFFTTPKWARWVCLSLIMVSVAGIVAASGICLAGLCSSSSPTAQELKTSAATDVDPLAPRYLDSPTPTGAPKGTPSPMLRGKPFLSLEELYDAVDRYLETGAAEEYGPIELWNVSLVTSLDSLFDATRRNSRASTFNADLSQWDTSNVQSMYSTFYDARSFNADLSSWNTSSVTNMKETFARATGFQAKLRYWDLSSVRSTQGMFRLANNFDDDLRLWDVSRVVDMSFMFLNCFSFQGIGLDSWDTSNALKMDFMFSNSPRFNGDLSRWNVSSVVSMKKTFEKATSFNSDLSRWDTSRVTTMESLFRFAVSFNADINGWNTESVTNLAQSFLGANSFLGEITSWDVSRCTDFALMFAGARFVKQNYCNWGDLLKDAETVVDTRGMFLATGCPIPHDPDFNNVENGPFCQLCTLVDGSPPTLSPTFRFESPNAPQPITSTEELHEAVSAYLVSESSSDSDVAIKYGWPVGKWDVSAITNFSRTFDAGRDPRARLFNEGLDGWNTSRATSMAKMFDGAEKFDQDLSGFDTSAVADMSAMFDYALSFTGKGVEQWDTSSLEFMEGMFEGALSFTADISGWETGAVVTMAKAFQFTSNWNSDVSAWDVSKVTTFAYTFSGTAVFNRDLGPWDVSSATFLVGMFSGATSFNKNLCAWKEKLPAEADIRGVFPGSGCLETGDPVLFEAVTWNGPFCRICQDGF